MIEGTARTSEEQLQERLDLLLEQEREMDDLIVADYEQLGETRTRMELTIRYSASYFIVCIKPYSNHASN
jgi:hypothetical protein